MLIKVKYGDEDTGKDDFFQAEDVQECKSFRIVRRTDEVLLYLDGEMAAHDVTNATVYVMNDDGKTIDRLR